MEEITHTIKYSLKQYDRKWGAYTHTFVDFYVNDFMELSIVLNHPYDKDELNMLLFVFSHRYEHHDHTTLNTTRQREMFALIDDNKRYLKDFEFFLESMMGKERFEKHYEKTFYRLVYLKNGKPTEFHETLHISDEYHPLRCLKMAHYLAKKDGYDYRILLSDEETEVDKELLEYALMEL